MSGAVKYIFWAVLIAAFSSCSTTRRLHDGEYMLARNKVVEDRTVPKKNRIKAADVEKYIQIQPHRKFLGTNLNVQLYNMAHPDYTRNNWWNRTLRKWGVAPVILDSTLVRNSADLIHDYVQYSGYYDSRIEYRVDANRRRKAQVTYTIEQGEPTRIGDINLEFRDEFLRQVVLQDSAATFIRSGHILDGSVLSAERERITENLRNSGYYDFTQKNIKYFGDATDDPLVRDLVVEFQQSLADYTNEGIPVYENNSIYRISKIVINPDYDPIQAATDPDYLANMDTTEYRGLYVMHPRGENPKVRKKILRQAVTLYPNYLYDEDLVRQAHANIMRLGYYRNSSIVFQPDEVDDDNIVTFIGGEEEGISEETTTEKYLLCHINSVPSLRQSYKIELEGTTSSSFNAINATVGYQNRNLFRGAELFDVTFRGGYEFMRTPGKKGAFEIGASTSLSFPRFISPIRFDRYNRTVNPRTKLELSVNTQSRRFYDRTLSSVSWGYSWSNKGRSSFTVKPIDLNLIKLGYLDTAYVDSLKNQYLKDSYVDQLVGGISGSYIYNSQLGNSGKHFVFRFNWETAGNLFNLATRALSSPVRRNGEEYYRIFGIRYAQYFRVDGSISDKLIFGPKSNIAFRVYAGIGKPYGNANSLPFDRFFYAGGSNSMRGWIPRRLGPGNSYIDKDKERYPNQFGDLKLEANLEFRFPVWSFLQGAVFFDLGNVWYLKNENPESVFKFNRFYNQLGFNTGLGMRFDVNVAVIRFDFGYKLHNPNELPGNRWVDRFKVSDAVINFGVGYPF